jgi:BlaI family transcriptional regulator, penicillinase repressor
MSRNRSLPEISDAEWRVMKTLWEKSPRTARDVVEALAAETTWKPKTIHTLLARLVKKGALKAEKETREHLFTPLVRADECQRQESHSFLERVFNGEVAPFLACFVRDNKLTKSEIEELKKILDGKAK